MVLTGIPYPMKMDPKVGVGWGVCFGISMGAGCVREEVVGALWCGRERFGRVGSLLPCCSPILFVPRDA